MFTQKIIDSDAFLDMPLSTQALYFHLNMRADDDGFINNPKKIQRMVGASDDDLKLLIAKNFIIPFESGVIVIKHWRINNYLQKDRYNPTKYGDEKATLSLDENGAYQTAKALPEPMYTQEVYTQDRLGKDRLGKDRLIESSTHPTMEEVKAFGNVVSVTENIDSYPPDYPDSDLTIFPFSSDYRWTRDNFGPLWIPAAGAEVELTEKNLPLYSNY